MTGMHKYAAIQAASELRLCFTAASINLANKGCVSFDRLRMIGPLRQTL